MEGTITTFDTGTAGTAIVYVDSYLLGSLTDTYFDLTATNRAFLLVYARNHNILGRSGLTTASAKASRPKAKTYYPSPQYDSRSGARVRVLWLLS